MIVFIEGHTFGYELQRVTQMFFPGGKITVTVGAPPENTDGDWLHARLCGEQLEVRAHLRDPAGAAGLVEHGDAFSAKQAVSVLAWDKVEPNDSAAALEHKFGVLIYQLLSGFTGIHPPWGVLTGVRPVKLFAASMELKDDENALRTHFIDDCLVSPDKFSLALETAKLQRKIIPRSTPESFSLYVSIPFCPTRCAYCSFVSHSVKQAAKLIPDYVDRLCEELSYTGKLARELGLKLRTVYFGGGTPTTLSAEQLAKVMDTVSACFDVEKAWEYTVEAGRPDTVTPEKLRVIHAGGAGRISINPQTLSDTILQTIGRRHTVKQFFEAFEQARREGFDSINADLIAGLPTDTPEGFAATVEGVLALSPENLTVHTLTVKRAAELTFDQARGELETVGSMVDDARRAAKAAGLSPYYLYRQTGTLGALENVGYARQGTEGLYNIYIMDETHTILAVGAGASTKLLHPVTGEIKRIFNYKYPYEYLSRFDEILRRKEQLRTFYSNATGA